MMQTRCMLVFGSAHLRWKIYRQNSELELQHFSHMGTVEQDWDLENRNKKNQVKHKGLLQESQELYWKESDDTNNLANLKVIFTYLTLYNVTIITSLQAMTDSYYFPSRNVPIEESKPQRSQHLYVMKLRLTCWFTYPKLVFTDPH